GNISAQIKLPALFNDNMVLQQQFNAPVWGWAKPGKKITITGSWNNKPVTTITGDNGEWTLEIATPKAGGPYYLAINEDTLHDVMIGEVWICSGQSNMQWALDQTENAREEIEKANLPDIRLFYLARQLSDEPQKDCHAFWTGCTPEMAKDFSAVAYYFGKKLHKDLNVPIGLIHTSWGASSAQAWVREEILHSDSDYEIYFTRQKNNEKNAVRGNLALDQQSPYRLYNAMIAPLIPFGIKGAIWYQGESNRSEAILYEKLFPTMIKNWRDDWAQGEFPFYYVQIAPFGYRTPLVGALLRDAQRKSLKVPNTGMAVTMDIGNPDNIHPLNKYDVGKRLALWALAKTYNQNIPVYSGPLYKSMQIKGKKAILSFDFIGSGLFINTNKSNYFEIAGSDKVFYPADVDVVGEKLIVYSKKVKKPLAVRYAFHNSDGASLFNKNGLPASSFRTDDWPIITEPVEISGNFNFEKKVFEIKMSCKNTNSLIRYTIDGSEPNINSQTYDQAFTLNKTTKIRARAFINNNPSEIISEKKFNYHLALGKDVKLISKYSSKYSADGDKELTNGKTGSNSFRDGVWQGYTGENFEVIVDLKKTERIQNISISFLQDQGLWIFLPGKLEFEGSLDGKNFIKVGEIINDIPMKKTSTIIKSFGLTTKRANYRYVKVKTDKVICPDWHPGAGNNAWLFVDEIIVE
ncbi:MAG: sialate O-acetylesterase, partial [Bacteroidota bacterium]